MIRPVPVVMFHLVCDGIPGWKWNHLCWRVRDFERSLQMLRARGYASVDLHELYDFMARGKVLPKKSVVFTFDDGYLDNWVCAHPLLKKYGFKGTVFVNPEFADPRPIVRPTLVDVEEGRAGPLDLEVRGFLSWEEMKRMTSDGVMDIQSHSLTHTWYFAGPGIVDFHHPDDHRYPWMAWNRFPERKPFYLAELDKQELMVPYGAPVYEFGKSLQTRRYRDDPAVESACVEHVQSHGGREFFSRKGWREELRKIAEPLVDMGGGRDGRREKETEYLARVRFELAESRRLISEKLNKPVDFLCWPGGSNTEAIIPIAREVGYKGSTVKGRPNVPGADPMRVDRVSTPTPSSWKFGERLGQLYYLFELEKYRGNRLVQGITWAAGRTGLGRKLRQAPEA